MDCLDGIPNFKESQFVERPALDPPTFRGEPISIGFEFPLDVDLDIIYEELKDSAAKQHVQLVQGKINRSKHGRMVNHRCFDCRHGGRYEFERRAQSYICLTHWFCRM